VSLLLGFAPFLVFALLERLAGPLAGLAGAAALSLAVVLRDTLVRRRAAKLLEVCSLVLFGGLAAFTVASHVAWSIVLVRLAVDAGLFLAVLLSLLLGRPFTLAYAKEKTPAAVWAAPAFVRINVVLTAAWTVAFAVLVASDAVMAWVPAIPLALGVVTSVAALGAALIFTMKYPEHARSRPAPAPREAESLRRVGRRASPFGSPRTGAPASRGRRRGHGGSSR
jgi:hypothetical protein